jgi:hypothetical protein
VTAEPPLQRLPRDLAVVAGIAVLWVGLYWLNDWAFHFLEKTQAANWIFLPAALRLIAVLVWGVPGALGLWLGALVTSSQVFGNWTPAVLIASPMSALAPLLAVTIMRGPLGLKPDLGGLSIGDLTQLAIANATCSAMLHSLVFLALNDPKANPSDILVMLLGDLFGTLVVLYAIKLASVALSAR